MDLNIEWRFLSDNYIRKPSPYCRACRRMGHSKEDCKFVQSVKPPSMIEYKLKSSQVANSSNWVHKYKGKYVVPQVVPVLTDKEQVNHPSSSSLVAQITPAKDELQ